MCPLFQLDAALLENHHLLAVTSSLSLIRAKRGRTEMRRCILTHARYEFSGH